MEGTSPANEPAPVSSAPSFDPKDVSDNKAIACLSYIGILFLVPLLAKKDSRFAQFHAKQGMVLFIVWVVAYFVLAVIPIIGWMLIPFASLFFFIVSIIGLIKTLQGHAWEIPVIKDVAKKFNL